MKAYVVVQNTITDDETYGAYRKDVMATFTPFGGKLVVRGGNPTIVEGEWPHKRLILIEFPSREAAEGWHHSAEYQKILPLRLKSSVGNLIIVDAAE